MDLLLDDEQKMFQSMFRDFAQEEIAPHARETDEAEVIPAELLEAAADQELFGVQIPEDYDGVELDWVSYYLLLEEVSKACLSTATVIAVHSNLVAQTVLEAGTEAQREQFLPGLVAGEQVGAFALTEPDAGSDVSTLQTTAVAQGEHYLLNGIKTWVSNAPIAGLVLVFAQTPAGVTAFVVPADTPGLTVGYRELTMGLRGVQIHALHLKNCIVPSENRLGDEGAGGQLAAAATRRFQLGLAAIALGAAEAALAEGRQFAAERKQFGVSIATKQAIRNYFADSYLEIEGLRHLLTYTAWKMDNGGASDAELAAVKLSGARVARQVANRMVQVHGGYGFSNEYAVSRIYRDVRALDIMGGTNQIMQSTVARSVFAEFELSGGTHGL